MSGNVLRDAEAGLVLARLQIGPRGRADRPCIELRESHPLAGQPVDVRRFVEAVAVTRQVRPAEIIGQDQDDVGRALRREQTDRREQQKNQTGESKFHVEALQLRPVR
jgi:hypothetical protein